MDKYEDMMQVLTLGSPSIYDFAGPKDAVELSKIANDEMAELVVRYPDRFVSAVASLPLNHMDDALKEADRALTDLKFRGVQISTDVNGKPIDSAEFLPLYEKMSYYDLPVLLHPRRTNMLPDYPGESESKYGIFITFGWPYETTVAMTRLVFSGVLEKYPNLKVITHHCGGMVPYFSDRAALVNDNREMLLGIRYKEYLPKDPLGYYRMFYGDTALCGNTAALMCGYNFFGADHILFGTDTPYDNQLGDRFIRDTILSINQMVIPDPEKKQIFEDNARKLFRLPI
jgi:aminocarboxymuconate-semialdehyde decarboxylase